MGRVEVPTDLLQQHAQLRTELREVARRTIPSAGAIDRLSAGAVAFRERVGGNFAPFNGAVSRAVMELSATGLVPGRTYQVSVRAGVWVDGPGDATMACWLAFTTDGTTPTTASLILRSTSFLCGQFGSVREAIIDGTMAPWPEDADTLRALFCVYGHDGGRVFGVYNDLNFAGNRWPVSMWITDMGKPTSGGIDYY